MNENAKAWVAALRSGNWEQATCALRKEKDRTTSFCCLGVANEMSGLGTWMDEQDFQDIDQSAATDRRYRGVEHCDDCDLDALCHHAVKSEEFASPMVQDWLGLATEDGVLVIDGKETSLARLNDEGKSFAEIADIIESNQSQLFK